MAEEAGGGFPELSADEWEAVARQLSGSNDGSWRGVLRSVCTSARDGVDFAPTTMKGGRRMDPRVLAVSVELLRWAADQGCGLLDDGRVPLAAVEGGRLGVLQWGVERRCWELPSQICERAAKAGKLEVLQWAREQGCPWVHAGNLELLQWARGEGCPWDAEQCWHMSVSHEHHAITEWIERQL
eukprot:jgi/Tetstr1/443211/TSEL_031251.t1